MTMLFGTPLTQSLMQAIGWALIHLVWQGFVVAAILGATLALMHRRSANARYLAASAALALLVVLAVATAWRAYEAPQPLTPSSAIAAIADAPAAAEESVAATLPSPSTVASLAAAARTHLPQVVSLWLIGVALLSLRLAFGWMQTVRMARASATVAGERWQHALARLGGAMQLGRKVRLLESAAVDVPTVIGWLRPVVLVPASTLSGLSPEQIEMVLAHELAHIRRYDFLFNLLQAMVETLLFYHPAVWWISRRMRIEREHCCDDLAIAICGNPLQYARALTRLEELRGSGQLAVAANGGSLLTRIKRLVMARPEGPNGTSRWAAGAALMTVLVLLTAIPSMPLFARRISGDEKKPAATTAAAPATAVAVAPKPATSKIDVSAPKSDPAEAEEMNDDDDPAEDVDVDVDSDADVDPMAMPMPMIAPEVNAAVTAAAAAMAPMPPGTPTVTVSAPPAPAHVHVTVPNIAPVARMAAFEALHDLDINIDQDEIQEAVREATRGRDHVIGANGKLSVDDLIELRSAGVTPQYIESMRATFPGATLNDLVRMRQHGVTTEYIKELRDHGISITSARGVTSLRDHGVTGRWLDSMKEAGITAASAREWTRLRDHGVDAHYIAAMRGAGFANLSNDDLVRLRDLGVTPEFVKMLADAGYSNLTAREIGRLAASGVNADFIRDMAKYKNNKK